VSAVPLLAIDRLGVDFDVGGGRVTAVEDVTLAVEEGECVAVVGESGSGKTQLLLACLGLLATNGRARGSARFADVSLLDAPEAELNRVRGAGIGLLSQDPMGALTPHLRIGVQLAEGLLVRGLATRSEARRRAIEALADVGIPDPEARLRQYPHELSGGMRQRVALAMALLPGPRLLFADEPTTALDVTVQARILELLAVQRERGLAVLLVTHDLGVVAGLADRVAVMYAGRLVELAPVHELFARPAHPYTAALLDASPRLHGPAIDRLRRLPGSPPAPGEVVSGCAFAPRCDRAAARCTTDLPRPAPLAGETHVVACHNPLTHGGAPP
jgi:oligopeptide transport system ATP-binding protein